MRRRPMSYLLSRNAATSTSWPVVTCLNARARFFREMILDLGEKRLGQIAQFLFAYAGNATELVWRRRITSRHFAQRNVRENHVGRDVAFVSQFATHSAQSLEKDFVALDRARGSLCSLRRDIHRLCQGDSRALTE